MQSWESRCKVIERWVIALLMIFGWLTVIVFGLFVAIFKKAVGGRDFKTELKVELVLLVLYFIFVPYSLSLKIRCLRNKKSSMNGFLISD